MLCSYVLENKSFFEYRLIKYLIYIFYLDIQKTNVR
nr:MAG TPA: hypothetical protein [Caudoviricetes sp.]